MLRRVMLVTLLAGGVTLAACDSLGVVGPGDIRQFAQAKMLWDARPFTDYRYEIRTGCFCPPEINQWARVEVRNGVVVDVEAVEPDPNYPITTISYWQPIDSLFKDIHRAFSSDAFGSTYARVDVTYDSQLGYPTSIAYVAKPNILDAGAVISVRNVLPLNGIPQ